MSRPAAAATLRSALLVVCALATGAAGGGPQTGGRAIPDPRTVATVTGVLTSTGFAQPLNGMPLALTTIDRVVVYRTATDLSGRFAFPNIRPGQYYVVVPRERYLIELGRIALRGGDVIERSFRKGVELSGTVTDERGAAVAGATVCALLRQEFPGLARYQPRLWGQTDARGRFLLGTGADAAAGVYIAAVMPTGCDVMTRDVSERLAGYPVLYAPDASTPADATEMTLDARESKTIVFKLRPGPTTRLEGRLVGYANTSVVPGVIILEPPDGAVSIVRVSRISADGRFVFAGLPTGSFRLLVPPRRGPDPIKWAMQSVTLAGEPVKRLIVPMQAPMAIAGQIDFAGHLALLYGTRVFLTVNAVRLGDRPDVGRLMPAAYVPVLPDGKFGVTGLMPGQYQLSVSGAEPWGWHTKSAMYTGPPGVDPPQAPLDIFDAPVTIEPGKSVFGLTILMTYLTTTTTGRVEDESKRPVPGTAVVVFSSDARYWLPGSRRVRVVATDKDGAFTVEGLPEGDYLVGVAPGAQVARRGQDPAFLETLRPKAVAISLPDGGTREVILRVSGKPPLGLRSGLNN